MISLIVAMSPNHAIGYKGSLPWHLPEDLVNFKRLTMGHTIIMGRHTFESLPHGALPGRRNVVLSKDETFKPQAEVYHSLEEALKTCDFSKETFIIGGAEVYKQALPIADKLYITLVEDNPQMADAFFPDFDFKQWEEKKKEKHKGFSFLEFIRL